MSAAEETILKVEQSAKNPHENETMCSACHTSDIGGPGTLIFEYDIPQLCQSCHDGQQAKHEVHPVNIVPSAAISGRMPSDFPLEEGKLTCSTCHNIAWSCPEARPAAMSGRDFLRGESVSRPSDFCFNCHIRENYQPFNVHDQLDDETLKKDTCLWCHISIPDGDPNIKEASSYGFRTKTFETDAILRTGIDTEIQLCSNCHSVSAGHPNGNPHMNSSPSREMMSYMSAYEIQRKMNLPLQQLIEYSRAANRTPRLIPLDRNGRITCYSCHNPHEKGLLQNRNPRSIGAEPEEAKNHRLRIFEGDISCRACHQK